MYKFELEVFVFRRPNFLDEDFEYESYVGQSVLRNLFIKQQIDNDTNTILLSFPERWLNIIQERVLVARLNHYYPNLKKVTIKTHSVYILQTVKSDNVRIVGEDNLPDEVNPDGSINLTEPTFCPMKMNLINPNKINVL